ncbi:MAG: aminotransferase class V-fold PLP-dependent enzyme [Oscillospiraceae bacterium]|nr:aminotransferase class V-fold PLP-dependent enzyme [Oscillospiraceae bacterium]
MLVYADHAATSPLCKEAFHAMQPWLTANGYGNASAMYKIALDAKCRLEDARAAVARALSVLPEEVYFTSGGTESDNWALKGAMELGELRGNRRHLITTAVEHPAVLRVAEWLAKRGCELTVLPVDTLGRVSPEQVAAAVRKDTALVSLIYANNEIGTILPIGDIFAAVKAKDPAVLCHTDAVQAVGHIPVSFSGVDLLTFSGHKFGGPKGTGALYIRKGIPFPAFMHGGGHERGRRSGTENIAGIAGLAAALQAAADNMERHMADTAALRDRLTAGVLAIPYCRMTGDTACRLPGHASFVFDAVEGETIVLGLDIEGVSASSGSACSSGTLDPSHVLLAIGLPHETAHGSLRLTIDASTGAEGVDYIISKLTSVVASRRAMSPLWDDTAGKPVERF